MDATWRLLDYSLEHLGKYVYIFKFFVYCTTELGPAGFWVEVTSSLDLKSSSLVGQQIKRVVKHPKLELPSYREAGVWAVDVVSRAAGGDAPAVTGQNVLTRSLKVKGPAIEGVVVRIPEHCAHTWLCKGQETKTKME